MNKTEEKDIIRLISIVLVAVILFTAGAFTGILTSSNNKINVNYAVGGNNSENVAATAATTAANTAEPVTTTAATTTNSPESTNPSGNDNISTTEAQTTTVAAPSGSKSVAEIVSLYNESANKIKKNAKSSTMNYRKFYSDENYLQLPSAVEGIGKTAMNTFVKGTEEPVTSEMSEGFPVSGTDYTSKLTETMVKSATCNDTGSAYEIEIILLDDTIANPEKGQGYAAVFNTVSVASIAEVNIPGVTFNKAEAKSCNGKIKATIEKSTGNLTELTLSYIDVLTLDVKVIVGNLQAQIGLATEENYSLVY